MIIDVVIPANNEERALPHVLHDIPKDLVREVVVVDNNSTDNTAKVAAENGAKVLHEPKSGYGRTCLRGIEYLKDKASPPDILVFIDGDYSDYPEELEQLVQPIINDNYDLVIGSRATGIRESGSMTPPQVFGNWLATSLMRVFYKSTFTDLGPFRAIKFQKLLDLSMQDKTYGWTIEMQIKALKEGYHCQEIPVTYRNRIGVSKVSGTIKGVIGAGYKIIHAIFKYL